VKSISLGASEALKRADAELAALRIFLADVSGALCDAGDVMVPEAAKYGEAVRGIVNERDRLRARLELAKKSDADSLREENAYYQRRLRRLEDDMTVLSCRVVEAIRDMESLPFVRADLDRALKNLGRPEREFYIREGIDPQSIYARIGNGQA